MDELLADFIGETRDMLEPLGQEIVVWEANPDDRERLDAIFRFVHTVKGSCGFLDLPRLERLAHGAESALAAVRSGERTPDVALVNGVLAIVDRIGSMVEALDAGKAFPEGGDEALIMALDEAAVAAPTPPLPAAPPSSGDDATAGPISAIRTPARSIRLPVELLDRMMSGVSDIVLARNELARRLRERDDDPQLEAAFERLSVCVASMRDAITRTRMQRIDGLFAALPRVVRDLSAELGRQVSLEIEGGDVELDREMIEMLRDPLTHIVRNALDHGIETPEHRLVAGKNPTGTLRIGARQGGNRILIEITDDGRGVDAERVAMKAVASGIVTAAQVAAMSWARKLELIFEAGLSTAETVTAISGRGVGMDVVRANIERIGGTVELDSRPGQGTRLALSVPLTLTIIPALTIAMGDLRFAIPRSAIDEIVCSNRGAVTVEALGGAHFATIRGRRMPMADLSGLLGMTLPGDGADRTLIVLRLAGGARCALAVDQVLDHEELVVKPAAPAVMATGIYAGATLPDNGQPMLLLDPAGLAAAAGIDDGESFRQEEDDVADQPKSEAVPTLLFQGLTGANFAVRLGLVERIIDVPAEDAHFTGGRWRLLYENKLIHLFTHADRKPEGRLRVLLLTDGVKIAGMEALEIIDVVDLVEEPIPAPAVDHIAGVLLIDGRPFELIDVYRLFERVAEASAATQRPLCVLDGADDPWVREMLRPLIEAAGYRTAFVGSCDPSEAAVLIASDGCAVGSDEAPVIRTRASRVAAGPDDSSIYRYDREALLEALNHARKAG